MDEGYYTLDESGIEWLEKGFDAYVAQAVTPEEANDLELAFYVLRFCESRERLELPSPVDSEMELFENLVSRMIYYKSMLTLMRLGFVFVDVDVERDDLRFKLTSKGREYVTNMGYNILD